MRDVRPLRDQVLVKKYEEESISDVLIVEREKSNKEPVKGKVLKVGPGRLSPSGERHDMDVEPDENIIFKQYAGHLLSEEDDEEIWLINEKDIIAVY